LGPDEKGSATWDVSKRCNIFESVKTRVQLKGGKPTAQTISVIIKKNSRVRRYDLFSDAAAALDGDNDAAPPSHPPTPPALG